MPAENSIVPTEERDILEDLAQKVFEDYAITSADIYQGLDELDPLEREQASRILHHAEECLTLLGKLPPEIVVALFTPLGQEYSRTPSIAEWNLMLPAAMRISSGEIAVVPHCTTIEDNNSYRLYPTSRQVDGSYVQIPILFIIAAAEYAKHRYEQPQLQINLTPENTPYPWVIEVRHTGK